VEVAAPEATKHRAVELLDAAASGGDDADGDLVELLMDDHSVDQMQCRLNLNFRML
jgi:hypothetical protein